MKKLLSIAICSLALALASGAFAQSGNANTAGNDTMSSAPPAGAAANTNRTVGTAPNQDALVGLSVYNENNDKIGKVKNVVISADDSRTSIVIGAGGPGGWASMMSPSRLTEYPNRMTRSSCKAIRKMS